MSTHVRSSMYTDAVFDFTGYQTYLIEDASKPVSEITEPQALSDMRRRGKARIFLLVDLQTLLL